VSLARPGGNDDASGAVIHHVVANGRVGDVVVLAHAIRQRFSGRPERYTPYLGVEWDVPAQKWRAVGQRAGEQDVIGLFDDEAEAAIVANRWRVEHAASGEADR
jgi:hypothetical protein